MITLTEWNKREVIGFRKYEILHLVNIYKAIDLYKGDLIMAIFTAIMDIFTCLGILIALFEFYLLRKSTYADYERTRKHATIDMYKEVGEKLYGFNTYIYSIYKRKPIIYKDIKNDKELIQNIKKYLNEMEWIATGINTYVYDIDVFDRLFGDVAIRLDTQLKDYIVMRRKIEKANEIYIEHDKMIEDLKIIRLQRKKGDLFNKNADIKNRL